MWLVIGFGSALHSDDRFGREVAEHVQTLADPATVEVVSCVQLLPELAEPISRSEGVLFVDASIDIPPGVVECREIALVGGTESSTAGLTHHCTPEMLLESARLLYGRAPRAWLYVAGGGNFELGETLSTPVEDAVSDVVKRIIDHATPAEIGR